MLFRLFAASTLVGILWSSSAGQVLYELTSPNVDPDGRFGWSVSDVGDVNDDGYSDVVVGADYEDPGSSPNKAGRAYVFSGADGNVLYTLISPNNASLGFFGYSVSGAGDANDDECPDIVVGACCENPGSSPDDAGRAYIFDGTTGALLHTLLSPNEEEDGVFGYSVSGAGDVNADGYDDVVVGALEGLGGRAYVFSGHSGAELFSLVSPNEEPGGHFGWSVSGAGDVNNDGFFDVIVGAHGEEGSSSGEIDGRAYVFSGADGSVIYTLSSPSCAIAGGFGYAVSEAGDTNNDGFCDVIVGALAESSGPDPHGGRAYVFSGSNGALIHSFASPSEETSGQFGHCVSSAGDVDADGCDDFIVGAPGEDPDDSPEFCGRAYVFSGASGALMYTLVSPNEEYLSHFGWSVSGARDTNADGFDDVIAGAWGEGLNPQLYDAGRAYVFSGFLIPVELSLFVAETTDEGVLIRWRTETENQCFGFHLFRRAEWENQRQQVTPRIFPGGGTSAVPRDYSYLDPITEPGNYRYWLEEVAEEGRRTEFGPVEVTIHPVQLALRGPYPNPVQDKAELRLLIPESISGPVALTLFDVHGRQVGATIERDFGGDQTIRWNAQEADLAPGVYWWQLEAGPESVLRPMVIVDRTR